MSDEAIRAVASLDDAELDDEDSLSLLEDFNRAADALPAHLESLSDETKLRFYALFKQATVGKCDVGKPGFFDWKGRAKWDAWNALGDLTKTEAMEAYVDLLSEHVSGWSGTPRKEGGGGGTRMMGPVCSTLAGSVDDEPEDALTAFFAALRSGDGAIVREYLSQGLPALGQACEGDGVTPLHIAADAGHLGVVRDLLDAGSDPNAQDVEGQTPLHCAAMCGHEEVARELLSQGANVALCDDEGLTAAQCAPSQWTWLKELPG